MKRRPVGLVSAIAVSAAVACGNVARAQASEGAAASAAPTLVWDAPAGCPTAEVVVGNVQRILANPDHARAPLSASARVTGASGEAWQASLTLETGGARTERRFQAESCDAIAAAAALIIAVAAEEAPDAPAPPPPSMPAPAIANRPARRPENAPVRTGTHFSLAVNGVFDWGTLPQPSAAGFEAFAGLKTWIANRFRTRLLAGVDYFPTRHLPYSVTEVFGDWSLFNLSVRGCFTVEAAQLEIGPCAGVEIATIHGQTTAVSKDTLPSDTESWFSWAAGAMVSRNVYGGIAIVARAEVVAPTNRPSFGTRDNLPDVPLYTIPAAAFRAAFGIEWSF